MLCGCSLMGNATIAFSASTGLSMCMKTVNQKSRSQGYDLVSSLTRRIGKFVS